MMNVLNEQRPQQENLESNATGEAAAIAGALWKQ